MAIIRLLLSLSVLVPLATLGADLFYLTPDVNDGAFHLGTIRNTIDAIGEGANPIDFWIPTWLYGFPLFHYYQPGPYLLVALLHALFGRVLSLLVLYRLTTLVAVAAFPLTTYAASRRLGLERETAVGGALAAGLVSGGYTYGIEPFSFTWAGYGLFAQAVALPLLPLALAEGWRAVDGRGPTIRQALALVAVFMAHILYGYIAAVSLGLAPLVARSAPELRRRLLGLTRFYVQVVALLAFFVVPLALDSAYHAKSLYDSADKFDSYGAAVVLTRLLGGALFDADRLPVLTCLALIGLYLCVRRWLEERSGVHGWIACGFVLWTLLYFGRPTWGRLVDLLPLGHGLHLERLSSGVQMFGFFLAAVAIGALWRWCLALERPWLRCMVSGGALVLLFAPAVAERVRYIQSSVRIVREGQQRYLAEAAEFAPMLERIQAEPPARVYAGHSADWGGKYCVGSVPVYQLLSGAGIANTLNAPFSWPLPTDFQYQFNLWDQTSYDLYDVRYVVTDQPWVQPPGGERIFQAGRHSLYRVASEGPFRLVNVPLAVAGDHESTWYLIKQWTMSRWPRQRAHARLLFAAAEVRAVPNALRMLDAFHWVRSGEPGGMARNVFDTPGVFDGPPPPPPSGTVKLISESRQEASASVDLPAAAVLMFKVTYHPGWRAWIDGQPAVTMLLTPGFTGVEVPAGRHLVRFEYRAGWLKTLLLFTGLLVALGLDWPRRRLRAESVVMRQGSSPRRRGGAERTRLG
ncbi:MAG TPA: YfhO family protein [Candidatus Dormibacteraeota bacterium]|nr:YfhO family protein [Candidatus Dormibacteraeota bacterium]